MTRYVLDTNLYIDATRRPAVNRQLVAFFTRHTPRIYLHSVVAGELPIHRPLAQSPTR